MCSPYILDNLPLGHLVLKAHQNTWVLLDAVWNYPEVLQREMQVENIAVSPENSLHTQLIIP